MIAGKRGAAAARSRRGIKLIFDFQRAGT